MLKKVLALALAGAMVLGSMSFTAVADTKDRTIAIGGLDTGDKVNFYHILKWADDSDEATENKAVQGWYWAEPFATIFDDNGDKGSAKLLDAINEKNQLILTDNLAGDIARAINSATVEAAEQTVTPVNGGTPVAEVNGTATYTFEDIDTVATTETGTAMTDIDGLYMAIVIPKDQDTVYNPIFVHLDSSTDADSYDIIESSAAYMDKEYTLGVGAAKKSKVTLTKESHNAQDYTDTLDSSDDPVDDGDTTKPDDILTFTVTSTIPGYGDTFKHPFFTITDKMNGLSLFKKDANELIEAISVTVGGEDVTAGANTFTFDPAATADQYTVKFSETYLMGIHVPTEVTVTYKARVLAGANTNVIKEKNTVEVVFSHDPSTENDSTPGGEKQFKKDITNHYTFTIDANNLVGPSQDRIGESGSEIIKIGVDKDGNPITSEKVWSNVTTTEYEAGPLAGAEFTLYGAKWNDDKTELVIDTTKNFGTARSDASGRLNFTGLDEGTYFLQETKAPAGYVKNSDPVKVVIDATLADKEITEWYDQEGNWYASKTEAEAGAAGLDNTKVTEFKYHTDELVSYSVTYGGQASTYTFDHAFESSDGEIKWNITTSGETPQSIPNVKGVELPSTGGVGTTLFYAGGAVLVLLAGVLLVSKRRVA